MPEYRAFILGPDGHVRSSKVLDCSDDEAAIEQAKQLVDGHDVELWERARRITLLKMNHKQQ